MYQARILDKNRQLKAVLPGVRWHYTRRINEATSVEVYIPREVVDKQITQDHELYGFFAPSQPFVVQAKPQRIKPNKAQYAEIASFIQIYKGDKLKVSGKIVGRTLGQVVTVEAYTEEILLEANLTPAQYGKVWDGWDLADIARDLLDGWQSLRVKAQSQWQDRIVASSNVDLTTNPGHVMLAKRSNGRYYDSGYITLVFNKSEIPNFKAWDRVRWSADSEEPVKTSIQISTNGTSFSAPFDGGFPEEVGYYIGGDHDQVWVRINLSTSDTESEDPEGKPVGVTPTVFAVEVIARTEGTLVAGNIPAVAGVTIKGLSADHASAFRVLVDACEQAGWEFNVWDGALNLAEALGVDRTKDFVFRAGSNIEIRTLGDDDDELVNILTAYGPGQGINRMEITLRDEASIAEFGEYPLAMEFEAESLAELQQKAQEFLDEHNSPKTQFEIAVAFEHGKEPEYGLGDKVRVADPETGIVTTTRIMAESREYGESGLVVNLELGKADFTLSEAIADKRKPVKPLDPLQPSGVYARGIVAGIRVGFAEPKMDDWAYSEVHVSTAPHFEPSGGTLRDKGKQTRFDIVNLVPGGRYYARVIHVDEDGRKSPASTEVSAVAEHMPIELLPDHSLGVDKFMEGLKPPILVTSKPDFPDPRYPDDTILFYTVDSRLYRVVGNDWIPLTVTDFSELSGQIQSNQIALDAIKEDLIAAEAIANRHIQTDAVTGPKIASEAVKANHIEPGAVTAEKIAHDAVQTEHIDTEAITETKISDNAISAPKIKTGAIEADKIAANAVTATKIAANAVTANKIAAGAVETEKLAANAVTAEKIAAGAIETNHISAGAVKADQIDANAVTAGKVAAGAITANKISAGAVETEKLAANAITAGKIAAGAIETNHISAGAVKADQIDANAVTASKIAAGAVTADKIGANAVTANKIGAGAVTADKIAAGAIQTQHLEAGAVTADKLTVDETTTNKITAGIGEFGGIVTDDVLVKSADGSTFFDGNVIVTKDGLGNRSEMSAGRLTFYRELPDDEEESAYYVTRMISGTASDGQTIPINFERPPKVLVAPSLLTLPPRLVGWDGFKYTLFDPSSETYKPYTDYQIEAHATNVTESGFTVWCRVTGDRTTSYVPMSTTILTESTPSRISGYSETPIDVIRVDLQFEVSVYMYDRSNVSFYLYYDIEYQESGSSTWVKAVDNARERVEIDRGFSLVGWRTKSKTHTFKREVVVPTPGIYRVRVTRRGVSYINWWWPGSNEPRLHSTTTHFMGWTGIGAEVLTTGTANYIAIEGGS